MQIRPLFGHLSAQIFFIASTAPHWTNMLPWKDNCTLRVFMVQRDSISISLLLSYTILCRLRRCPEVVLPDINLSVCTAKYRNCDALTLCSTRLGKSFLASSVGTAAWTTTSSPGLQFAGVVTLCLSVSWRAERKGRQSEFMESS